MMLPRPAGWFFAIFLVVALCSTCQIGGQDHDQSEPHADGVSVPRQPPSPRGARMAQLTALTTALKIVGAADTEFASPYFFDSARQKLTADWVKYRFAYVISQTPAAKGVTPEVGWAYNRTDISDYDLVCYIVGTPSNSVIKARGFAQPVEGKSPGLDAGLTVTGDTRGNISEVYLTGKATPKLLANIICHELMHNKCKLGNEMHGKPNVNMGSSPTGES